MSAILTALIAGGVAAGATGLGHGIAALTPAARAQRKMRKQMTADAEAMMARGKREGWGYSQQKKRNLVEREMRAAETATAGQRDDLMRQTAMMGAGRGGVAEAGRAQMARDRAEMGANIMQRVRAESQQYGQAKQDYARNLYAQAQGLNLDAQQRAASALSEAAQAGVNAGVATYGIEQEKADAAALRAAIGQLGAGRPGLPPL